MQQPARIAFICEGDAESHHAFSGTAKYVVDHLRRLGHDVTTINATPGRYQRWFVGALSFRPNRDAWQTQFRLGSVASAARGRRARRLFAPHRDRVDAILQIGPALLPPEAGAIPFVLFCDWNMALSIRWRDNPSASTHRMRPADAERINKRHAEIYRDAAAIFTISEFLRQSFIQDYGIPEDRVVTVYAGSNLDAGPIESRAARGPAHRPTILFSGKEFHRKGGDLLLEAFRRVRQRLPAAALIILGLRQLGVDDPGVEFLGFLDKNNPAEFARLIRAYSDADVFCLPARLDPFPNVVREAMSAALPCVVSDIGAMPEMVVDGQTGFTVPVNNVEALADRLLRVLENPETAHTMGLAGRRRQEQMFTWEETARKMHATLQAVSRSNASRVRV